MTLYARGYRPYEGARNATPLRFWPIARDGYRTAARGWAYWVLNLLGILGVLVAAVVLYVGTGLVALDQAVFLKQAGIPEDLIASYALGKVLVPLQQWTSGLATLVVLFAGAGLIADDMRSRAFPLYLVRPITPFDYYLGKLLVPLRVLASTMLVPGLLLIVIAALFQPSERMLPFFWAQRDMMGAVLGHFAVAALSYSSLALLVSTWAGRRGGAWVLGSVLFFGSAVPRHVARLVPGTLGDVLDSASLYSNAESVLKSLFPASPVEAALERYQQAFHLRVSAPIGHVPPVGTALLVSGFVVLFAAWTVLRRARTVEVVA